MKFRKKPVVIDAVRWDGSEEQAMTVIDEFTESNALYCIFGSYAVLSIQTLEGSMQASPGDWIIKGIKGEFYPCKPDIFEATYEPAESPDLPTIIDPPGGEEGH